MHCRARVTLRLEMWRAFAQLTPLSRIGSTNCGEHGSSVKQRVRFEHATATIEHAAAAAAAVVEQQTAMAELKVVMTAKMVTQVAEQQAVMKNAAAALKIRQQCHSKQEAKLEA